MNQSLMGKKELGRQKNTSRILCSFLSNYCCIDAENFDKRGLETIYKSWDRKQPKGGKGLLK